MTSNIARLMRLKRPDAVSLAVVACHIAFVLCPIYIAAAVGPGALLILLWLWYGLTMHGLLNLMHECAHYHVFRRRWGSDVLGRWILAPLMLADFDNYRQLHWSHHRNLGGATDPKYTYKVDIRRSKLVILFLRCLVGAEALKKFSYQKTERAGTKLAASRFWMIRVLIVHFFFAVSLFMTALGAHDLKWAAVDAGVAYLFVYIYGLASLTLFIATLRAIAEHQRAADDATVTGAATLRNLDCGTIERLIFGCYGFAEHATHHLNPAIPSYNLRDATRELKVSHESLLPKLSYRAILKMQVLDRAPDQRPATRSHGAN